jgi:hypothetical protein
VLHQKVSNLSEVLCFLFGCARNDTQDKGKRIPNQEKEGVRIEDHQSFFIIEHALSKHIRQKCK